MSKARKIISLNIIMWYVGYWWALVLNSRYIFAVSCHSLQHGVFGHRPLLLEELVPCESFWILLHILCSYGKHTQSWLLFDMILQCWVCSTISGWLSKPKPFSHPRAIYLAHKSFGTLASVLFGVCWPDSVFNRKIQRGPDYPPLVRVR